MGTERVHEALHVNGVDSGAMGFIENVDHLVVLLSWLGNTHKKADIKAKIQIREWVSSKTEQKFRAKYLRPEGDAIILQREDGKLVKKAIATLAPEDAEYIESLRIDNGSLPHS